MNSQKKSIDVWLIYRCLHCDDTLNITILSRTHPELIDKELYHKFITNDKETAQFYAFDPETIRRNQIEVDYSQVEYEIIREKISLHDISRMDDDFIMIELLCKVNFPLKLTSLIREYLGISLKQLEKMVDTGIITIPSPATIKKCKIRNGLTFTINRLRLKEYLVE